RAVDTRQRTDRRPAAQPFPRLAFLRCLCLCRRRPHHAWRARAAVLCAAAGQARPRRCGPGRAVRQDRLAGVEEALHGVVCAPAATPTVGDELMARCSRRRPRLRGGESTGSAVEAFTALATEV